MIPAQNRWVIPPVLAVEKRGQIGPAFKQSELHLVYATIIGSGFAVTLPIPFDEVRLAILR